MPNSAFSRGGVALVFPVFSYRLYGDAADAATAATATADAAAQAAVNHNTTEAGSVVSAYVSVKTKQTRGLCPS